MWAHKISSLLPKRLPVTTASTRSLSAIVARGTPVSTSTSSSTSSSPSPLLSSPSSLDQQQAKSQQQQPNLCRSYVSRAHPRPIPEFSVPSGLQMVLDGVEERKSHRAAKWERNKDKRRSKGIEVSFICI